MKRFRIALVVATGVLCLALLSAHLAFGQSQWFVVGDGNYQLVKPTRHGIVAFAVPYNRDLIERERPQAGKPGLIVTLGTTPIIKTTRVSSTRLSHLPVEVEAGSSKVLTMTVADETVALIASAGDWVFADSSPNGSTMVWSNQSSSAIWASAVKTWSPRPVTDDTNKGAFLEKIRDAYPEGWFLAWAQNPKFLSDGHTIVFQSNRNTKSFVDGLSLWTVDLDGKNEHLLLDAATFAGGQGHLEFIGERGASLLVYEAKEGKVYLADRTCTALKPLLDNAGESGGDACFAFHECKAASHSDVLTLAGSRIGENGKVLGAHPEVTGLLDGSVNDPQQRARDRLTDRRGLLSHHTTLALPALDQPFPH